MLVKEIAFCLYDVRFTVQECVVRLLGSGCSTAVDHAPHDKEVMGLNPAWAPRIKPGMAEYVALALLVLAYRYPLRLLL